MVGNFILLTLASSLTLTPQGDAACSGGISPVPSLGTEGAEAPPPQILTSVH